MILKECLKDESYSIIAGNDNCDINDVVYDSRKANKDNCFVAITGAAADGHDYIKSAFEQGCRNFVVEKDLKDINIPEEIKSSLEKEGNLIKTENTRISLALMSGEIFNKPEKKLKTVAITGTKGKTTTTFMIKASYGTSDGFECGNNRNHGSVYKR